MRGAEAMGSIDGYIRMPQYAECMECVLFKAFIECFGLKIEDMKQYS